MKICCSGRNSSTACERRCSRAATFAFYQRLEEICSKCRPIKRRSRAALGEAYHDIGELTAKIGSQTDALAALSQRLGAASGPRDRAGGKFRGDCTAGDSLIAVGDVQGGNRRSYRGTGIVRAGLGNPSGRSSRQIPKTCGPTRRVSWKSVHGIEHPVSSITAATPPRHLFHISGTYGRARRLPTPTRLSPSSRSISLRATTILVPSICASGRGRCGDSRRMNNGPRAISQKLTETDPEATQFQSALAQSYIDIGYIQQEQRTSWPHAASFEQARAISQKLADVPTRGHPLRG